MGKTIGSDKVLIEAIRLKELEMVKFIKDVFCIDGTAEYISAPITFKVCVKCNDKRRGVFFVGWGKQNEKINT